MTTTPQCVHAWQCVHDHGTLNHTVDYAHQHTVNPNVTRTGLIDSALLSFLNAGCPHPASALVRIADHRLDATLHPHEEAR